jgi:hypothetical protein
MIADSRLEADFAADAGLVATVLGWHNRAMPTRADGHATPAGWTETVGRHGTALLRVGAIKD